MATSQRSSAQSSNKRLAHNQSVSTDANCSGTPVARMDAWLRLAHSRGLGYSDRRQILESLDYAPERLFNADVDVADLSAGSIDSWIQTARLLDTRADLEWLEKERNTLLTLDDPRYPSLLKEINDPPLVLYVTGDVEALDLPQLAIVGSRNATPDGMRNARRFAGELASSGLVITSGLAIGIDGAAHGAAISAGGKTVAVMATGPDLIYPRRHHRLAEAIAGNGMLVSEFRCGTRARPSHFARRNRLISGLSLGTLIVEGAEKSGSMITARLAGTQGRDVFAVPGPAGVVQYRGCHRLIRQGAMLVEDPAQLIADLGWRASSRLQTCTSSSDADDTQSSGNFEENCQSQHALLAHIGYSPMTVDDLVVESGFTVAQIAADVVTLEIQGFVNSLPGGLIVRSSSPPCT